MFLALPFLILLLLWQGNLKWVLLSEQMFMCTISIIDCRQQWCPTDLGSSFILFNWNFMLPWWVTPRPPATSNLLSVSMSLTVLCLVVQSCSTLCNTVDSSLPGSSVHGDSKGRNTGEGCYALPQGNFPTQESNSGLPHCRRILYCLSHQGSPSYKWNHAVLSFWVWVISLNVMSSRFMAGVRTAFLFRVWIRFHCMDGPHCLVCRRGLGHLPGLCEQRFLSWQWRPAPDLKVVLPLDISKHLFSEIMVNYFQD